MYRHPFWISFSYTLSIFGTVIYPFCFKKQTLEFLFYLSFKVGLPTNGIKDIFFFSFKNYPDEEKVL